MGGTHSSPTALGLGISAPHPPQISEFCFGLGGGTKVLILCSQTTGDLKSNHLQAWVTLTALSVPSLTPFLSAELWVNRYHVGNLSQIRITVGGARAPQRAGDCRETAQSSCTMLQCTCGFISRACIIFGHKWQSKTLRCPYDQHAVPVQGSDYLPAMCLQAMGLRFFKICQSVEGLRRGLRCWWISTMIA